MKVFYILLCILSCLSAEASPAASRQHLDLGLFVKSLSVGTQQKLLSNDGYLSSTQGATRGWTAKERAASVNSEFAKRQHICALAEKHDLSCDDVVFTSAKIYLTQGIANPLYVVSLMKSEEEEIGFPSTFPKNCGVSNPSIDFSASVTCLENSIVYTWPANA